MMKPKEIKPSQIQLSSIQKRTIILCDTWIERERILNLISKFKKVGSICAYEIAPNIDFNPENTEYQTITRNSFLLNDKGKIEVIVKINSVQIKN